MKIIYICGPMRGIPEFNFPAFYKCEEELLKRGFDKIYNPARMESEDTEDRADTLPEYSKGLLPEEKQKQLCRKYATRDIAAIFNCTHLTLLPGWQDSVGGNCEFCLAK